MRIDKNKHTKNISEYSYEEARKLLIELISAIDKSRLKFNPRPIEWNNEYIVFGMVKHYGRLRINLG
jgi:hypothetical protein